METKTTKVIIITLFIVCTTFIIAFAILISSSINNTTILENKIDSLNTVIEVKDFTYKNSVSRDTYDSLWSVYMQQRINYDRDVIEAENCIDSLTEELTVANIKLERIKEYNRIAGQGNNIVFLRGWINRVLNE